MSVSHPESGLPPLCGICGTDTVRIGKLPRVGLRPLVVVYKCVACNLIASIEPDCREVAPPCQPLEVTTLPLPSRERV
jgi:hypothetical protein